MTSTNERGSASAPDLRLLQVMLAPGDGGAETFFEKLAIAFQGEGVHQRLIICEHARRYERLKSAGCDVVQIPAKGWRKWLARGAVRRIADDFGPTVQMAWMSRAASALSRRNHCVNIARLGGYYPLKYYSACDWLVGNTPSVMAHLDKIGWPAEQSRLISNFGEVPDAGDPKGRTSLRAELKIEADTPVILTLGRLHENKAQDVLIKALADVPEARLWIAGEGELRAELESLAQTVGVLQRVHFLGWRSDIPELFKEADICAFPSRREPLGNVILEAWANEVPVASAASEGPSWLIEHEVNGLLFPIDDVSGCAAAVRRLLDDRELGRTLAHAGNEKWRREFSKDAIVEAYLDFFAEIGGAAQP